jgi:hypothetical protein
VKINTYALVAMLSFALAVTPCGATTMTALAVKQQSDKQGWAQLMQSGEPCDASKAPDAMCALAAITLASEQCAADARFFQRQRSGLSNLSLALILVSAAFTGGGCLINHRERQDIQHARRNYRDRRGDNHTQLRRFVGSIESYCNHNVHR